MGLKKELIPFLLKLLAVSAWLSNVIVTFSNYVTSGARFGIAALSVATEKVLVSSFDRSDFLELAS